VTVRGSASWSGRTSIRTRVPAGSAGRGLRPASWRAPGPATAQLVEAELADHEERFDDDAAAHLGLADAAIAERDRTSAMRAPARLARYVISIWKT